MVLCVHACMFVPGFAHVLVTVCACVYMRACVCVCFCAPARVRLHCCFLTRVWHALPLSWGQRLGGGRALGEGLFMPTCPPRLHVLVVLSLTW